jgi:hypothetical protein
MDTIAVLLPEQQEMTVCRDEAVRGRGLAGNEEGAVFAVGSNALWPLIPNPTQGIARSSACVCTLEQCVCAWTQHTMCHPSPLGQLADTRGHEEAFISFIRAASTVCTPPAALPGPPFCL